MLTIGDVKNSLANAAGEFQEGDTNTPGTLLKADWLNAIEQELVNVVQSFGGRCDPKNNHQIAELVAKRMLLRKPDIPGIVSVNQVPQYPIVETPDNRLEVLSNGENSIRITDHQTFIYRGINRVNTSDYAIDQRRFGVIADQLYHLRWNVHDGFALKNTTDRQYNPAALPETDPSFDTRWDDMLIARITTDQTQAMTITTLINCDTRLLTWDTHFYNNATRLWQDPLDLGTPAQAMLTLNFARQPTVSLAGASGLALAGDYRMKGNSCLNSFLITATRYHVLCREVISNTAKKDPTSRSIAIEL